MAKVVPDAAAPVEQVEVEQVERPLQVRVRDFAQDQAPRVGWETAYAFVALFPTDTATIAELEAALAAFQTRRVS